MTENLKVTKTHIHLLREMHNRINIDIGMVVPQHQWKQAEDLIRCNLAGWNTSKDDPYLRIRLTEKGKELWIKINQIQIDLANKQNQPL